MHRKDHHRRVGEIFIAAQGLDAAERVEHIANECGSNAGLRRDVEALLRRAESDAEFLEQPVVDPDFSARANHAFTAGDPTLDRIGDYRVHRLLGQGAMGKVYLAEQLSTGALVALKVLHPTLVDRRTVARFEQEAKILGRLRHAGIAQIYDADSIDLGAGAQPIFVMEYVDGLPLITYAEQADLTTNERLGLIARIADAVHHAHEHGVVHRDLKPDNILVTSAGNPKVLDFGIARVTNCDLRATMQTVTGQILGTVRYMSPEQTKGHSSDVDSRSDVYSLGVLAHELLSGRLPYELDDKSIPEALRVILDHEPTRLGTINSTCRGDVEIIIGRALEKDPERRYASAAAFANDLRRYLHNEPIVAKPATMIYRVRKFSKRNPGVAVGTVSAFLLLMVISIVSVVAAIRISNSRDQAVWQSYMATISAAEGSSRQDNLADLQARLDIAPESHRGWEWFYLSNRADQSLLTMDAHEYLTWRIAFIPGSDRIVSVGGDGFVRLWDTTTGQRLVSLDDHGLNATTAVGCSQDGSRVATGSIDGAIHLRHAASLETFAVMKDHVKGVWGLSFSPDGTRLVAAASDGSMILYDGTTGEKIADMPSHDEWIWATDYSPDGALIASGSMDDTIHLIDAETLEIIATLKGHQDNVHALAFSPDSSLLASTSMDKTVRIWDVASRQLMNTFTGHEKMVNAVGFMPDGRRVVSAGEDGLIIIWNLDTSEREATLVGHIGAIRGVKVEPGGHRLASAGYDGTVRLWNAQSHMSPGAVAIHPGVVSAAFHPAEPQIAYGTLSGALRIENWLDHRVLTQWQLCDDEIIGLDWNPERRVLAAHSMNSDTKQGAVRLFETETSTERWVFPDASLPEFSPDGSALALAFPDEVKIIDVETGETLVTLPSESRVRDYCFTSDGQGLIVGYYNREIWVWDFTEGKHTKTLRGHTNAVNSVVLTPDQSTLISASEDFTIRLWNIRSGAMLRVLQGHNASVVHLAITPDSERLASASADGTVRVWSLATGDPLLSFQTQSNVKSLDFSHDGSQLGCASAGLSFVEGNPRGFYLWDGFKAAH